MRRASEVFACGCSSWPEWHYWRLLIVAGQAVLAAFQIHDQVMADGGRLANRAMNVVARGAFHSLVRSLEHSRERRARTNCRGGGQVRIRELRCRITHANGMHVGEVRAAAERLNGETGSVGANAAV